MTVSHLKGSLHFFVWEATNDKHGAITSGMCFYGLEIGEYILQRKMVLIR